MRIFKRSKRSKRRRPDPTYPQLVCQRCRQPVYSAIEAYFHLTRGC